MTIEEFSNGFDTLISAYSAQHYIGTESPLVFDEYEKSLFLTEAQDAIVKSYYSGEAVNIGSFEETECARRSLDKLVDTAECALKANYNKEHSIIDSKFYSLPTGHLYTIYEWVKLSNTSCSSKTTAVVVPTTHDDLFVTLNNPFRFTEDRVLRLNLTDDVVELISKVSYTNYYVRYLRKPNPIILVNLGDLTIDGKSNTSECELDSSLHFNILEKAVQLALISKSVYNK